MQITVREILETDAQSAATLSGEFGYPASAETMRARIRRLAGMNDHQVFVAGSADTIIGWIDVGLVQHLQSEPYGEIGGFVVTADWRSKGVGRALLARAEEWIKMRGVARALVRSQIKRAAAHRFYLREGYSQVKTSAVFEKKLADGG